MAELLNLKKGDLLNLTKKEPGLVNMRICAGWDVATKGMGFFKSLFSSVQDYDLDLAHYLLDADGKVIDTIAFFRMAGSGLRLHGDNLTGAGDGDDEIVTVQLNKVPDNCVRIVTAVVIYQADMRNQSLGNVKNAFVRIVNEDTNKEICRYNLSENGGDNSAVIVSEFVKENGEWTFKPVEKYSRDSIKSLGNKLN